MANAITIFNDFVNASPRGIVFSVALLDIYNVVYANTAPDRNVLAAWKYDAKTGNFSYIEADGDRAHSGKVYSARLDDFQLILTLDCKGYFQRLCLEEASMPDELVDIAALQSASDDDKEFYQRAVAEVLGA